MAEQTDNPQDAAQAEGQSPDVESAPKEGRQFLSAFRSAWQGPLLIGAGVMLTAGLAASFITAPKQEFDPWLERAERLIELERYDEAIETLNTRVFPYLDEPELTPSDRRQFHTLLARSLYLGQFELGMDVEINNRNILDEYTRAEQEMADLTPEDEFFLADTLVRLDEIDTAIQRADDFRDDKYEDQRKIYRRAIGKLLGPPELDRDKANELLGRMAADTSLPLDDRVWVLSAQTEIRLRSGYPDEAIDALLRAVPRLREATPIQMAPLYVWLADAYQQLDPPDFDESLNNLARAERALRNDASTLIAKVHLLTARALISKPDTSPELLEDARDRLAVIADAYRETPWYMPSLKLVGEVEADLGDAEESLASFETLVSEAEIGRTGEGLTTEGVTSSLVALHIGRMASGAWGDAMRYARLAERLNLAANEVPVGAIGSEAVPDDVLLAIASASMALADELAPDDDDPFGTPGLFSLDPATRREAGRHLRAAGSYYRSHSDRMALVDNDAFGASIWRAANAYDRAGERQFAIDAFRLYADSFPNDERQAEARYRLGQAYQALSEYEIAIDYYLGLIEDRSDSNADKGVGPFADASYVPLAQCYLLDGNPNNDNEAESLLLRVVQGQLGGTRRGHYRDAVIELGRLYYQAAAFPRAIERFEEAVDRYPDDEGIHTIKFMLADSYRQASAALQDRLLTEAMPDSQRVLLEEERDERLRRALFLFSEVRDGLEAKDARRRNPIESLNLQHAYYYLGDCAFDLRDFPTAIRHYDAARERYPSSPSSLVAMVQIVNSYVELGDFERARTADQRARRFFEGLPGDALEDPNLPMDRRDWERWLDSSSRLYALESTG